MNPANAHLQPSDWLFSLLISYERFRPTAYKPTPTDKWTIGYGHTAGVKEGDTCTLAQAQAWLHSDVAGAVNLVKSLVKVALNQNQFDALVSLVFNAGPDPLERRLGAMLNIGNVAGAALQFKRWDRQAGVELPGLEARRVAEMSHFLTPDANA